MYSHLNNCNYLIARFFNTAELFCVIIRPGFCTSLCNTYNLLLCEGFSSHNYCTNDLALKKKKTQTVTSDPSPLQALPSYVIPLPDAVSNICFVMLRVVFFPCS